MKWTTLAYAVLEGAVAASEMNRERQPQKIVVETRTVERRQPEREVKVNIQFGYTLEELETLSTQELRNEVYSLYKENDSILSDKYAISKEAFRIYYGSSNMTERRYRATMIKFLIENGTI
jgi:hypothetical protein